MDGEDIVFFRNMVIPLVFIDNANDILQAGYNGLYLPLHLLQGHCQLGLKKECNSLLRSYNLTL